MAIFLHEVTQNRKVTLIWSAVIGFMIVICLFLYPEMENQMDGMDALFSQMGSFSQAFGMDKISFGSVMGFYGIECGNMLGLGGAFFAAFLGIHMLSKEEGGHTAEFLLTHPLSRSTILFGKLAAVFCLIVFLNLFCILCSLLSFAAIKETPVWDSFFFFHLAQFLLQLEIASICFGISAFLKRGGIGIGLGLATLFYFLNILTNISPAMEWITYITPFQYADPSDIISSHSLSGPLILLGIFYSLLGIAAAFLSYQKKDISA